MVTREKQIELSLHSLLKASRELKPKKKLQHIVDAIKALGWDAVGLFTYTPNMLLDQSIFSTLNESTIQKFKKFRLNANKRKALLNILQKRNSFYIEWDDKEVAQFNPKENIDMIFSFLGFKKSGKPKGLFIPLKTSDYYVGSLHIAKKNGEGWQKDSDIIQILSSFVSHILEQDYLTKEIRKTQKQYQALFQDSSNILLVTDQKGKILFYNNRFAEFSNSDEKQFLNRPVSEVIPLKKDDFTKAIKSCLKGERQTLEGTITNAQNRQSELRITLTPRTLTKNEKLVHVRLEDVTHEKTLEKRVRGSEKRYKLIFDHAVEGIALLDINGNFTSINAEGLRQTGYSEHELLEKKFSLLLTGENLKIAEAVFDRTIKGEPFRHKKIDIVRKDGQTRSLAISSTSLLSDEGNIMGIALMSRDITEQERALKEKKYSEEQYKTLTDNLPVGIYRSTPNSDSTFATVNPALVKLIGAADEEDAKKLKVLSLYSKPEIRDKFLKALDKDGFVQGFETTVRRQDGTVVWVSDNARAIKDDKGKILYIDGILEDITERKILEEELRESERRYRLIAENVIDVIWTMDMKFNLTFVSPSVTYVYEYQPDELTGQPFKSILTKESWQLAKEVFDTAMEQFDEDSSLKWRNYTLEMEIFKKDGSKIWTETYANFVFDENRIPTGIHGITRDISDRKKAEQELRSSEERFRQVAENIKEVFWLENLHTKKTIYISPAYEQVWGRKRENLYDGTEPFFDTIHPEDRERVEAIIDGDMKEYDIQYRIVRPDGTIRWIHDKAFPVVDTDGSVYRRVGIAEDITKRRSVEIALTESEEKYRKLIEMSPDFICIQHEGRIEFINSAGVLLLGSENVQAVIGRPIMDFIAHDNRKDIKAVFNKTATKNQKNEPIEIVFKQMSGKKVFVELAATPFTYKDTTAFQIVARDITERKRIEREKEYQLKILDERVKERTGELAEANKELIRASQTKSEFFANISHELRSPLTSILGYAEMLQNHEQGKRSAKKYLDIILDQGNQLLRLVNSLLEITRLESGSSRLNLASVNINDLVRLIVKHLQIKSDKAGTKLTTNLDPVIHTINLDGQKVYQVIRNLVENSIKFSYADTTIVINTHLVDNEVQVKVTDAGIGIPKSKLDSIFDPFVQADGSSTRSYEGAGLGLHIVKSYVDMHHGRIWVESELNRGSSFTVCFPTNLNPPLKIEEMHIEEKAATAIEEEGGKKTILVVDDDQEILQLMKLILGNKYNILLATNGKEGVEKALISRPSLIFMDLSMPVLDGYEAAKILKQKNETCNIPIIALSARAMKGEVDKAKEVGCVDHVAKPFKIKQLETAISRHIK